MCIQLLDFGVLLPEIILDITGYAGTGCDGVERFIRVLAKWIDGVSDCVNELREIFIVLRDLLVRLSDKAPFSKLLVYGNKHISKLYEDIKC